jgi:phenylacetate-CoA ligase
MNRFIEKIYYQSPLFIQNVFVSAYGLKLYNQRYIRKGHQYLYGLKNTEGYDYTQLQAHQESLFVELSRHAIRSVPYYKQWAENTGTKDSDIQNLSDLKKFPILTKAIVRQNPEQFISDIYSNKKSLISLSTSGTSGSPMTIYCDSEARSHHYAFWSRLRSWFGLKPRSRRVTLFGRIIMLPKHNKPPFWRYDMAQNNLLMSSYHLSYRNLPYYYMKLNSYQPEEIIGYPSSIYQIARYILQNRLEPLSPKVVITTAETLLEYQRELISAAFDAPIVDQYGCTEMAFFASQCEHGTMHVHPEHGIVETVDEAGNNVNGQSGSMIATGLINWVMPLIRYEIGDRVALAKQGALCRCGRAFPVIQEVEGRIDDMLYRKDGTPVGRLDPVFKGGSGILEAKIIQMQSGDIEVLVQPGDQFGVKKRQWLNQELRKRVGSDIGIKIKEVDKIPKEANGKFKAVESYYTG